ncbi:MAG: molecular chaperone DjlA [Robiginitomaculum sp.]|nr:MAG: molecular chaperone DjlA [Robiginitomaculum sp.]
MNFGLRILGAAARLFGPPHKSRRKQAHDASFRDIGDAGVAAALIALGAKLAKADGVVTSSEIDAFKNVFQASVEANAGIARFFDLAKQTTLGYQAYAKKVYRHYKNRPDILEDVLDGLFHIALADSIVTDAEIEFLETTARIFKFDQKTFSRIRIAHLGRAADDPYLILGIDEDISGAGLKKAYRKMAAANHPDRLVARGLPPELQKLATHKMAMINKAYSEILLQRKKQPVQTRLADKKTIS